MPTQTRQGSVDRMWRHRGSGAADPPSSIKLLQDSEEQTKAFNEYFINSIVEIAQSFSDTWESHSSEYEFTLL